MVVGEARASMGGSHYQRMFGLPEQLPSEMPRTVLHSGPRAARDVAALIRDGLVVSAHDVSDGGMLVAVAEMLIAGSAAQQPLGASLDFSDLVGGVPLAAVAFGESPSRYVLEVEPANVNAVRTALESNSKKLFTESAVIGELDGTGSLREANDLEIIGVEELARAWMGTLDW
jgi:phosphoribosylformylglycinamidine synthase